MSNLIVQMTGGLGNQLFQYAMGRKLSITTNTRLLLDLSWFDQPPGPHISRTFELDAFMVKCERATQEEITLSKNSGSSLRAKLANIHPRLSPPRPFTEAGFEFDPRVFELKDGGYLIGYWQSEKYFIDVADHIRSDLIFRSPLLPPATDIAVQMEQATSVSVHVRRGDYYSHAGASARFAVCGPDYFAKALDFILVRIPSATFFVFSDDIAWAEQHLHAPAPVHFIKGNSGPEDMRLMALCEHHIIANSSFSWWGAWLNNDPNKVVIAPRQWFKDPSVNTKDLLPETWFKL